MRTSFLLLLALAVPVTAQTYSWTNAAGGNFSTAGNWSPAGPPGAGQDALFNNVASYSVNFTGTVTNNSFNVGVSNVIFLLNGNTWNTTALNNNGFGTSGASTSVNAFYGGNLNFASFILGNNCTVNFGTGVTANIGNTLSIGNGVPSLLRVDFGADVVSNTVEIGVAANGTGNAILDGTGSTWGVSNLLRIGKFGTANLSVVNGAAFTCNTLELGYITGASGTIIVGGGNATFTASGIATLGGFNPNTPGQAATLNVNTGGNVNFNAATNLRSVAVINLNGGTLNLTTLAYQPGAVVNWASGSVAFADGANLTPTMLDLFLNGSNTLGANRTLNANTGTFTLTTPLIVAGKLNASALTLNAPVNIQPLGVVSTTDLVSIPTGQSVTIENLGTLATTSAVFNDGFLQLNGSQARVTGFVQNLSGVVQGIGRFTVGMNNGTTGTIRVLTGHYLVIDGIGNTNSGNIELNGGTLEYTKPLSNLNTGFISGRGEFRGGTSNPGGNGLSNLGVIAFSAGFTDVRGDVLNNSGGKIVTAGGGVTTFYDDVTHNGAEIRTQAGGRSVFFGSQSGAGPFTGTGIVEYSGDLRPGNSPALVTHEGTVILNSSAKFVAELDGTTAGTQYDQLRIAGAVYLAGTLQVTLLNGFTPALGSQFRIVDNTSPFAVDGTFNNLPEGSLFNANSTLFTITYAGGTGNDVVLTVVPIPEPLLWPVLALFGLAFRRQFILC
ncbi:hypothetical protein BH11PLA2_BH11PLA2_50330 [soil metagenome]